MRSPFTRALIGVVVLGLCVGAAFGAGMAYQRRITPKAAVTATATTTAQAAASRTPQVGTAGSPVAGGTPSAGVTARAGGYTAGTIETVSGQALTITTAAGTTMNVTLSAATRIGAATAGDQTALKAGTAVLISGQRDASGNVQAASVVTLPSGFLSGE